MQLPLLLPLNPAQVVPSPLKPPASAPVSPPGLSQRSCPSSEPEEPWDWAVEGLQGPVPVLGWDLEAQEPLVSPLGVLFVLLRLLALGHWVQLRLPWAAE